MMTKSGLLSIECRKSYTYATAAQGLSQRQCHLKVSFQLSLKDEHFFRQEEITSNGITLQSGEVWARMSRVTRTWCFVTRK